MIPYFLCFVVPASGLRLALIVSFAWSTVAPALQAFEVHGNVLDVRLLHFSVPARHAEINTVEWLMSSENDIARWLYAFLCTATVTAGICLRLHTRPGRVCGGISVGANN